MSRLLVATACLGAGLAHATLGVSTTAATLHDARTVVIVHVTTVGAGWLEGTVAESFRGPAVGAHFKIGYGGTLPGTSDALVVCDGDDNCAVDRDRGGYFIIHLPGRKAPLLLHPGVVERRALGALVAGKPAHALCVHAHLHFIDEPAADAVVEGSFAAADGSGTLDLTGKPLATTLLVGGPTATTPGEVQLAFGRGSLIGGPVTREAGGCLAATVVPEEPLARTATQLAKIAAGTNQPVTIASGTAEVTAKVPGIARGKTALRIESGPIIAPRGPLFADSVLCSLRQPDATGGLRVGCQAKGTTSLIWLDFGPAVGARTDLAIAALVADGKPHVVKLGVADEAKPIVPIGTATLMHVAD